YLTLEEVEAVSKIVFTDSTWHIEFIRDMFLFSCFTGLRFSDVQSLRNKNVTKEGEDYYIEIRMNKTQGIVKLPISLLFNGKAVDIVKKYENKNPEEYLFPRISNQKANMKLKVISVIAKIDKNLTFHVSRHTFGTNLASATSDQFLIKELMGHTDIKTSMTYIHTSQEHIKNKLKNTNWG
ncbi:MAG: site-specific integrase, partial [Bacteroidales bacterium]|nr:site-specific integrase [Bacteroidales bacterium]